MNVDIRLLELTDKTQFIKSCLEYVKECVTQERIYPVAFNTDIGEHYWHLLTTQKEYIVYLAEQEHLLVGFVIGEIHSYNQSESLYYQGTKRGEAWDLYVHSNYRGQGIGSALLKALEVECKKRGCEHILLNNIDIENKKAQHLYRNLGYSPWVLRFYKKLS